MGDHDATLFLVDRYEPSRRIVVKSADRELWIDDALMAAASDPDRERIPGDMEIDGDQISFGTPGEGLGRLTYRITGHDRNWTIAERVETT